MNYIEELERIHPQFRSIGSVGRAEIEGVANGCEVAGITACTELATSFAVDGLDNHRTRGSYFAFPLSCSKDSVVDLEIEGVANGS